MKRSDKKAQIELSFGMIFSIILIISFIAFAFWGIMKFLDSSDLAKVGTVISEIREDVSKMWQSNLGSSQVSYSLPSKIKYLCFADMDSSPKGINRDKFSEFELLFRENENMFFYPPSSAGKLAGVFVEHLAIKNITSKENPFCVALVKNKAIFSIKKEYGNPLVQVEK